MDWVQVVRAVAALLLIIAAMGGLGLLIRRLGFAGAAPAGPVKRLRLLESLSLDPRRRAVLLACDDKAHLVILGPEGQTIVKTDLPLTVKEKDKNA
ncbi:MAG: flagellar biosynthetic protein FliO [Pseudomonadota bacterium]